MQIIRIALAGFGAERVFNRAGAIVDTMYQFVFLKCFECAKQCNPVGFLELLFEFGETYCRGLFGKHLQHQFAHSGWLDVAVVEEVIGVFIHDAKLQNSILGECF